MRDLKIYGTTDVGMVRPQNEDNYLILDFKEMSVLCVADGMGGHIGGREASLTAVETIKRLFNQNRGKLSNAELIEDCLILANHEIKERASRLYPDNKTGTTATLVVISGRDAMDTKNPRKEKAKQITTIEPVKKHQSLIATYGHIGDSRLYSVTPDTITQVSKDHTMLQRMLDAGALKPEEAGDYPHKNVIYKSLGGSDDTDLDPVKNFEFPRGEILLLCSDGLSGYLTSSEMHRIIKGTRTIREATHYMVELAKFRGGDDNITVILVEQGKFSRHKGTALDFLPPDARTSTSSTGKSIAILALLSVLIILVALLIFLLKDRSASSPSDPKTGADQNKVKTENKNGRINQQESTSEKGEDDHGSKITGATDE